MTKVWVYSIASFFSLSVLLTAQYLSGEASMRFMGESLGLVIVLLSCQICFHLNGVDELLVDSKLQIFLQKILKSVGAGLLLAASLFYIFPRLSPGYAAVAASVCFLTFALVVLRPIVRSVIRRADSEETLIIGPEMAGKRLFSEIIDGDVPEHVRLVEYSQLETLSESGGISRVVIAEPDVRSHGRAAEVLLGLKLRGVRIESAAEAFERATRKVWVEGISPEQVIFSGGFTPSRLYLTCKRIFDILLSTLLLVVTAPLMALIAIAIKLSTPGPAIFSQERVGFRGRTFNVYKFRSMRQDAEKNTGPMWAKKDDDRITPLGAFLRKCRLDELPQMWNVLRGEMSFVGPRPERPYFVDLLKTEIRYYDFRHYVKPGITGWAQVMYRYGASVEDSYQKLQYDLYYAKNSSMSLDLMILLKTIKVVTAGEGR